MLGFLVLHLAEASGCHMRITLGGSWSKDIKAVTTHCILHDQYYCYSHNNLGNRPFPCEWSGHMIKQRKYFFPDHPHCEVATNTFRETHQFMIRNSHNMFRKAPLSLFTRYSRFRLHGAKQARNITESTHQSAQNSNELFRYTTGRWMYVFASA